MDCGASWAAPVTTDATMPGIPFLDPPWAVRILSQKAFSSSLFVDKEQSSKRLNTPPVGCSKKSTHCTRSGIGYSNSELMSTPSALNALISSTNTDCIYRF